MDDGEVDERRGHERCQLLARQKYVEATRRLQVCHESSSQGQGGTGGASHTERVMRCASMVETCLPVSRLPCFRSLTPFVPFLSSSSTTFQHSRFTVPQSRGGVR